MPGEQKGKKHAPGAGRPPLRGEKLHPVTVSLTSSQYAWALVSGEGSVAAAVRSAVDLAVEFERLERENEDDFRAIVKRFSTSGSTTYDG